jgi:hypothetical protein
MATHRGFDENCRQDEEEKDAGNQGIFEVIELDLESNDGKSVPTADTSLISTTSSAIYLTKTLDFFKSLLKFGSVAVVVIAIFIIISTIIRWFLFQ